MKKDEIIERLDRIEQLLSAQQPKPLTLAEAADYLAISKSRLYSLTSRAEIPHFKPSGKKIYFRKVDLDAHLMKNRVTPRSEIQRQVAEEWTR